MSLDGGQRRALQAYGELVGRWNPVAGLVAADDLPRFASRHLLDSLVLAPLIRSLERQDDATGRKPVRETVASLPIADFGSGAGLPGVPLAIALPDLVFTLVDRSEKKARFLRRVRDELTLTNVRVLCADIRSLPRASYRGAVARAVMPLPALWPHARAALLPGGYLLVLDRMLSTAGTPAPELPDQCDGGEMRRHWTEIPGTGAWHGALEIRETNP